MMNTTTLLSRVSLLTGGSKLCELKGHEHDPAKFYEVKGHDTTDPHLHTTFLDTTQELCRHHQHAQEPPSRVEEAASSTPLGTSIDILKPN